MRRVLCVLISLALLGLLLPRLSSAAYDLSWQTVDGGGSQSTSSPYTLTGAVGQPDAGAMSGGNYALHGGFWVMAAHINVKQGATTLPDGTGTYDFGSVTLGSSSAAITFTIENTGLALLGVSSIQPDGDFSVTQVAASATVRAAEFHHLHSDLYADRDRHAHGDDLRLPTATTPTTEIRTPLP